MKRLALAIALACVLSGSALAGDIHGTDAPAPGEVHTPGAASPGDGHAVDSTAPGEMGSGGLAAQVLLTILDVVF